MKKQVVLIHGGTAFGSYKKYLSFLKNLKIDLDRYRKAKWSSSLQKDLGGNFDVLFLRMPNPMNANYVEWEILFKKIAPLLKNNIILIGHSLGGIFLAKYLSKNKFPKKISAIFLLAAPYNTDEMKESLGNFMLPKNLNKLAKQGGKILIYHSKDDTIVPYAHLEKYKKALPKAILRIFKNKGHFNQDKFPELVKNILAL